MSTAHDKPEGHPQTRQADAKKKPVVVTPDENGRYYMSFLLEGGEEADRHLNDLRVLANKHARTSEYRADELFQIAQSACSVSEVRPVRNPRALYRAIGENAIRSEKRTEPNTKLRNQHLRQLAKEMEKLRQDFPDVDWDEYENRRKVAFHIWQSENALSPDGEKNGLMIECHDSIPEPDPEDAEKLREQLYAKLTDREFQLAERYSMELHMDGVRSKKKIRQSVADAFDCSLKDVTDAYKKALTIAGGTAD